MQIKDRPKAEIDVLLQVFVSYPQLFFSHRPDLQLKSFLPIFGV